MNYPLQSGSLADRVCSFFRRNPEDDLMPSDIGKKFDVQASSVSALLVSALNHGLLLRAKDPDTGATVYRAGPNLASSLPEPATTEPGAKPRGMRRPVNHVAMPAPEDLVIEKDVALPPAAKQLSRQRYLSTFAAMAVGDSFAVPTEVCKRMTQAAHAYGKPLGRKFSARQIDPKNARIWRTV